MFTLSFFHTEATAILPYFQSLYIQSLVDFQWIAVQLQNKRTSNIIYLLVHFKNTLSPIYFPRTRWQQNVYLTSWENNITNHNYPLYICQPHLLHKRRLDLQSEEIKLFFPLKSHHWRGKTRHENITFIFFSEGLLFFFSNCAFLCVCVCVILLFFSVTTQGSWCINLKKKKKGNKCIAKT